MAATRAVVALRLVASSTRSASRSPRRRGLARRSWPSASRAGADGVQRVALGTATSGQPLGSAHLHDPLAVLLQRRRQAGAEAARSLHRPAATARQLRLGEAEQLPVAGGVGAG